MSDWLIYGAGNLGRYVNERMQGMGMHPLAFIDANPDLAGQRIDGLPVFAPQKWMTENAGMEAACVLSIWNPQVNVVSLKNELAQVGFRVIFFTELFDQYPDAFLPYYCFDAPEHMKANSALIEQLAGIWEDDQSKALYEEWIEFFQHRDFQRLSPPEPVDRQYFDNVVTWQPDEVIMDCGAYTGDTLKAFIAHDVSLAGYIAIEPCQNNYAQLEKQIADLPVGMKNRKAVTSVCAGVGSARKVMGIGKQGSAGAYLVEDQSGGIDLVTIDELSEKYGWPTVIKMDIEGAEQDALRGSAKSLGKRPLLEICLYHRQSDIWMIPSMVAERWNGTYAHYLRRYGQNGFELVYYAIPRERFR